AAMIRRNIDTLKEYGISVSEIRALGGGARSPLWNQIKADMTGVPILTVENDETPAVGAAVLAGEGSGLFPDLKNATRQLVRIRESFSPNPAFISTYNEVYRRYCMLSDLLNKYWK
ncbi:MAG: carbohydrate kinase, partial [Bacteroidales bacterium]|nr:carbohydrate kinase [Bacteroidales bacterium]